MNAAPAPKPDTYLHDAMKRLMGHHPVYGQVQPAQISKALFPEYREDRLFQHGDKKLLTTKIDKAHGYRI